MPVNSIITTIITSVMVMIGTELEDRRAEVERQDRREPGGLGDLVEVHHAERRRDDRADDDAREHGDVGEKALGEAGDGDDDAEHDQRQDDVVDRRVERVVHRRREPQAFGDAAARPRRAP